MHEQTKFSSNDSRSVKTILIVEDDTDIGEFLVQALKDETPYEGFLVSDGFAALKTIRTLKPHLFILDYLLPGMNGLELYDHLRAIEELEQVPILFMSASLPRDKMASRQFSFLKKPFDLDEFFHIVSQLLEKREEVI